MIKEIQRIIAVLTPECNTSDKQFQDLLNQLVGFDYGVIKMSDDDAYYITDIAKGDNA
jgi:peroxiredoxin